MSEVQLKTRGRRVRRGAGRSAEPGQNDHLRVPYISRKIPTYDILSEDSLSQIEATAERIMAEIGVEFRDDPEVVELFRAAGAQVTDLTKDSWNLKFAPGMIREILKTAPERFTQVARPL